MRSVEKVFTVAVPVERAWSAFADGAERSKWEASTYEIDPRPGGAVHWTLPGIGSVGRVEEVVPNKLLRQVELDGPHASAEITVTFEDLGNATRITIVHAGFGDGEWEEWLEGTSVGWSQAIADLIVYLETGFAPQRFCEPMQAPGMHMRDEPGGIRVDRVLPGGLAEGAGLRPGDLLLRVGGVPVFAITDVCVLMRRCGVGDRCTIEYLRDGVRLAGEGTVTSWDAVGAA